jgi:hypothetical protein
VRPYGPLFISEAGGRTVRTLTLDPTGSPNSGARHQVATLTGGECHRGSSRGGGGLGPGFGFGPSSQGGSTGAGAGAGATASRGGIDAASADGSASTACLSMPMGCALSPGGDALYIAVGGMRVT